MIVVRYKEEIERYGVSSAKFFYGECKFYTGNFISPEYLQLPPAITPMEYASCKGIHLSSKASVFNSNKNQRAKPLDKEIRQEVKKAKRNRANDNYLRQRIQFTETS